MSFRVTDLTNLPVSQLYTCEDPQCNSDPLHRRAIPIQLLRHRLRRLVPLHLSANMSDPLRVLLRGCRPSSSARSSKQLRRTSGSSVPAAPRDAAVATYADGKLPAELDFFQSSNSTTTVVASRPKQSAKNNTELIPPASSPEFLHSLVKSARLHAGLTALGLNRPTAIQRRAIPTLAAGHDVIAVAPTGSGKTLAYALPILDQLVAQEFYLSKCRFTFAVIIAPTKELTTQIARVIHRFVRLCQLHIDVLALVSRNACATARNNAHSSHIVVATPHALSAAAGVNSTTASEETEDLDHGRTPSETAASDDDSDKAEEKIDDRFEDEGDVDVIEEGGEEEEEGVEEVDGGKTDDKNVTNVPKRGLVLSKVRHIVLDEADELLRDQFVAQVDAALSACGVRSMSFADKDGKDMTKDDNDDENGQETREGDESRTGPRVHMFSATLPPAMQELAVSVARSARRVVVGGGGYGGSAAVGGVSETIDQRFHFVGGASEQGKVLALRNLLRAGELKPPILVFVQCRQRAAALLRELSCDGIRVDAVHADRTAAARGTAVARFRTGSVWMLIATDLLARGLDFKHVNTVVNYDLPQSPPAYLHRIGRTGRNGRPGTAFTFFTDQPSERALVGHIAKIARAAGADVPDWLVALAGRVQADQLRAFIKHPPKRPAIGGPNRASLKHNRLLPSDNRKRKQDDINDINPTSSNPDTKNDKTVDSEQVREPKKCQSKGARRSRKKRKKST